jgi:hypothetical protein
MSQVKPKKPKLSQIEKSSKAVKSRRKVIKVCENCKTSEERFRTLQNALKEVIDQNDILRSRVAELEALVNESAENIQKKKEIISGLLLIKR